MQLLFFILSASRDGRIDGWAPIREIDASRFDNFSRNFETQIGPTFLFFFAPDIRSSTNDRSSVRLHWDNYVWRNVSNMFRNAYAGSLWLTMIRAILGLFGTKYQHCSQLRRSIDKFRWKTGKTRLISTNVTFKRGFLSNKIIII